MSTELCGICGGDGRINDGEARCPSCRGTGRKVEDTGFRDVTKTKPSHYKPQGAAAAAAAAKETGPTTGMGQLLAREIDACTTIAADTKARLVREVVDHEATHGKVTETFVKKVRKQLRGGAGK
jgi:DnaJ-class molecular chaperone